MIVERIRALLEKGRRKEAADYFAMVAAVPLSAVERSEIEAIFTTYTKQTRGKPLDDPFLQLAIEYSFTARMLGLIAAGETRTKAMEIVAKEGCLVNGTRYFKGEKSLDAYFTRRRHLFD